MKKIIRSVAGMLVSALVAAPMLTSCYDDSGIWETIEKMEDRITALEEGLTGQAQAMASLLSNGATIKSCVKQKDGSYLVTLSDDTKFTVLPAGTDFSALLTYQEVAGIKYWAVLNKDGRAEILNDAAGKPIPVETKVEVKVKDGKYFIVINGVEYETGYDAEEVIQVFESCTPIKDAAGNVYAMTFSFGNGVEVTVSVDGYNGVIFKIDNAASAEIVTEYYVPYGTTQSFLLDLEGVVDYALQIPYGWKTVERTDETSGKVYLDITAPSEALVEAGTAFAGGDLKAVAVVKGGDATITKLVLSAEPFKNLAFSSTRLVAEPYAGLVKFAYGLVPQNDFQKESVISVVENLITSNAEAPAGYAVSEKAVNLGIEEILGSALNPESRYVLFVLPVLYDLNSENLYYVDPEMLQSYEFGPIVVKMSDPVASLFDARFTLEVKGTDKMWAGTALKVDGLLENIVYSVQNEIIEPVTEGLVYSGKASEFPTASANEGVEFMPATTYVTWCIPYDAEKTAYTADDVIYKEFTTSPLTLGGIQEVTAGESTATHGSISTPLSSEGAAAIYYAYLTADEGGRLGAMEGMDEFKFELIQNSANCRLVKGDEAVALVEGLLPESTMWLYAAAVDNNGKYSKVLCRSVSLPKVSFNSLTLSYESVEVGSDEAQFKIAVANGTPTNYIYWCGTLNDPFWVKCGKLRTGAEKYMAVYPDADEIQKVMRANGEVSPEGVINISGLRMEEDYVIMVLAQDETGKYSKGAYKKFTTLAADLGTVVVTDSEQWVAAKNSLKLDWVPELFVPAASQGLMAEYAFKFSCPDNLTAYVMCASDSYFSEAGFTKMAHIMIEIENYASRKYDNGHTVEENGQYKTEPDYYKNGELRGGQMMNVYDFYVHGFPAMGFATYFAKGSHGEGNCIYWDNGVDVSYQRALDLIAEYNTIAPYLSKAEAFGLKGNEATDWAQALFEAYKPYYKDAKPIMYENDGTPLLISTHYGTGVNDKGVIPDRVIVMLKDLQGNYYEPMYFEVPNHFEK